MKMGIVRFLKFENYRWNGVEVKKYKDENNTWLNVCRQVIAGKSGEKMKFHLRYFEIESGGYSTLEKHKHEHVVICVRGKGKAIAGDEVFEMKFMDVLYVGSNVPHQFVNDSEEPFGFFCIVDSRRDKPKLLTKREIFEILKNEKIAKVVRIPETYPGLK
ncbi:MAG: cupin domain-containing protein [Candidatus Kryptonium sp.]|nr:cupin domain-containing protein [Candidatus Kryptonium sp.]MCX7762594.1 cupin domain-containing protein [Candidatus Kryptonium sp.]MDW8109623.1 cupin domain-containing protein [Candidatus Kryptonium sp.]